MSITSASSKKGFFDKRRMWFFLAVIAAVVAAGVIFVLLQAVTATSTYYVLNKSVPARTLITQELLTPVTTSQGGQPRTALTLGDVLSSKTYAKYALNAGDIVTKSNAGTLSPLTQGLPANYVVASFNATPSSAVGGKLQRGDYVDLFYIGDNGGTQAHLFLQRVLIIDATIDLDSGSGSTDSSEGTTTDGSTDNSTNTGNAADSASARAGVPVLFTVGLTQENAAKLAVATKGDIYVVLSSAQSTKDGAAPVEIGSGLSDIFSGVAGNAGEGTDATFKKSNIKSTVGGASVPVVTPTPDVTDEPSDNPTDAPSDSTDKTDSSNK